MHRILRLATAVALPPVFVVCWSSGFVGAAMATSAGASATTTLLWRYLVTAALLIVVTTARRRRLPARLVWRETAIGLPVQALYLGGVFAGVERGVPAGTSALIASLQPLLVAIAVTRWQHTPMGRRRWLGLAAGVVGVALAVGGDLGAGGGATGILLVLGGMLALTAGTLLGDRWPRLPGTDLADSLTIQALVTLCFFTAIAIPQGAVRPPSSGEFWRAVILLVCLAFAGGYGCYLLLVERWGSLAASGLLLLTPGVSAMWAAAAFGEAITPLEAAGFVVALLGVAALSRRRRDGAP